MHIYVFESVFHCKCDAEVRKYYCKQAINKCVYFFRSKAESCDCLRFCSSDTFLMMSLISCFWMHGSLVAVITFCLRDDCVYACVSSLLWNCGFQGQKLPLTSHSWAFLVYLGQLLAFSRCLTYPSMEPGLISDPFELARTQSLTHS